MVEDLGPLPLPDGHHYVYFKVGSCEAMTVEEFRALANGDNNPVELQAVASERDSVDIIVDYCPDDWIDAGEVPVEYTDAFGVCPALFEGREYISDFISQHCVMDPDDDDEWEAITPEEFLSFIHSAIHGAMDYGWRNGAVL